MHPPPRIALAFSTVALASLLVARDASARRCSNGTEAPPGPDTAAREPDERDVCVEREIYLMPGAQFVTYVPAADGYAPFFGAGVQISPIQWSHNNDRFGPSQGGVYFGANLLKSASSPATMSLFEMGTTLSLERNASRRYLIPYFGFSLGLQQHAELPKSGYLHALGGVHLYWHPNVMVDVDGGYHFPFAKVDTLRGPRAQMTARFSMW